MVKDIELDDEELAAIAEGSVWDDGTVMVEDGQKGKVMEYKNHKLIVEHVKKVVQGSKKAKSPNCSVSYKYKCKFWIICECFKSNIPQLSQNEVKL